MKSSAITVIALFFVFFSPAQNATIANMISLSNQIQKPYNESQASLSIIDNIALDYVGKGYILSKFYDTTTLLSGNTLKAKSAHILTSIDNKTDEETISVLTTMNDGSGYSASCSILFSTMNFKTYQKWLSDIKKTPGYTQFNLNSLGRYMYKNTQTGKTITIGMEGRSEESGGTNNSTQYWELNTPAKYYCIMNYH
ncbi:MAG TPA: hypothetical protein VF421_16090 [Niabella sp.]